jgi:hypothetical protein
MRRMQLGFAAFVAALFAVVLLIPTGSGAQSSARGTAPLAVKTKSDAVRLKLDRKLRNLVASGTNKRVFVFATVRGNPRLSTGALRLLRKAHVARARGVALIVGSIRTQQVTKLAGARGVVAVRLIELKQTARPLGIPDPGLNKTPSVDSLQSFMNTLRLQEVPYSEAPPLRGSNFEQLKNLALLDAKTHRFAQAWQAGYTGDGETGAVLDGGTDWGHPDLIGTWRTGANGWPRAFDPFGTLIWLVAPSFVDQGLSWHTKTQPKSSFTQNAQDKMKELYRVSFATRIGPSRNFGAPDGFRTHSYTFPKAWTKSGTVMMGSHPDDHLLQLFTERPAFIVTDPNTAGVYDTVHVDLDDDYQFADEKPVTKASPASYRDMNGDGFTDISGGLLYYISDGSAPIPGGLTSFGVSIVPDPGRLLAWTGDYDPAIEGHGTLTASNVVGQGVINGNAPTFGDVPGGTYPGAVIGGAPKAKLLPFGDIYFSFEFSTQFAYFLTNAAGANVTTNSYGNSAADNDGYDAASQEADFWHDPGVFGGRTTAVFSTGNGAPGFGTTTPPAPYTGMKIGASTQFGGTGWDSIANASQITDNDVMVWSNRGPGATGANGVDVVADGAFSAGDLTLNSSLNGRNAWETWGGTSRSAPVAGAAALLVYDAYKQAHGGSVPVGFEFKAREILKSSAKDLRYDSWIQGAGSVDAARATQIAASGGSVAPDEWRPGDYRGTEYPAFANVIAPGGHDSQAFTIDGSGSYAVSDRYLQRTDRVNRSFTTARVNKESVFNFNAPDYLIDISDIVQAHPDADLMVVRANFPYAQFDGNGDYSEDQAWRLLTYNWTDINHDGRLWTDVDGDGAVDHVDTSHISNVDDNFDINFAASEMQKGEYVRFMYHRPGSPTLQSWVRQPNARMADGIFLGLQHTVHNPAIPQTSFQIRIDFYENVDWPWVSTPSSASGNLTASIDVPAGAEPGMYDGAIVLTKDGRDTVVPVSVAVKADVSQDAAGNITGSLHFGGAGAAAADDASLYNNGTVFGATDWTWRAESGDWRFYYYDAALAPPAGTLFLADTTWDDAAPYTDLDTLVMGRSANTYQLLDGSSPFGAPYILDTVGKSANTNIGAGIWTFNTATGGSEEIVAAPAQEGLHLLAQHQVNFQADKFDVPFETTLGSARVTPAAVNQTTTTDTGSFDVTFQATVDLAGLEAEAFGLSQPSVTTETAHQDDPNDPSTASVKKTVTISHASRARFEVHLANNDIDLFVLKDGQVVGSSTTASGDEVVELTRPPDGTYEVWVHGFSVTGTPTFPLTIDVVQGNDLTVSGLPSGAVPANTPVTIHVAFSKAMTAGQSYFGELQLGPPSAPAALSVPIRINRS